MSTRRDLLAGGVGLTLGVIAGWDRPAALAPAAEVTAKPTPRVVCTRVADAAPEAASGDCSAISVRRDWCNARLTAATRPRPTTAPPEAVGVDDPVAWKQRLDTILAACHLDASVANTDCTEYPCVSALRVPSAEAAKPLEDGCGGAVKFAEGESPALVPTPVECGDHVETLWMFAVLDQPTLDDLYPKAAGEFLPNELLLLGSRRAEALARGWVCGAGATDTTR
jgi:hypothetical protein